MSTLLVVGATILVCVVGVVSIVLLIVVVGLVVVGRDEEFAVTGNAGMTVAVAVV